MAQPTGRSGFEPAPDAATRRALFDLQRQISQLRDAYSGVWNYRTGGVAPPGDGNITSNGPPVTELYIAYADVNGVNRILEMEQARVGDVIWLRGASATDYAKYDILGVTPGTGYYTFSVEEVAASGVVSQNVNITVTFVVRSVPVI